MEFVKIYSTSLPNASKTLDQKVGIQSLVSRLSSPAVKRSLETLLAHGELNFWDFGVRATPQIPLGSKVTVISGANSYSGTVIAKINDESGELGDLLGWARQFKAPWKNVCALNISGKAKVTPQDVARLQASSKEIAPSFYAPASIERHLEALTEGNVVELTLSVFERDPVARKRCLEHYGYSCQVCSFNFGSVYGELGQGFIHVHHIVPLSQIREIHRVDPVKDLVPVCPNCHAMLHIGKGSTTVDQLKAIIKARKG